MCLKNLGIKFFKSFINKKKYYVGCFVNSRLEKFSEEIKMLETFRKLQTIDNFGSI